MALISDQWSTNPDDNQAQPPYGAPEGGTSVDKLNDIDRVGMASQAEHGTMLNALGTMSTQNANAVAITGGTLAGDGAGLTNLNADELASGVVSADRLSGIYPNMTAGDSQKLDGVDPTAYTLGVGEVRLWYGLKASIDVNPNWQVADGTNNTPDLQNLYLRGASQDTQVDGSTQGTGTATSAAGGDHSHGGNTDGHALTEAELAPHTHTITNVQSSGNNAGSNPGADLGAAQPDITTESTGGGQPHTHPITASGTHTHDVDLDDNLSHARLWIVIRIA